MFSLDPVAVLMSVNDNDNAHRYRILTVDVPGGDFPAMGVSGQRNGRSVGYRSIQEAFHIPAHFGLGYFKFRGLSTPVIIHLGQ